MSKTIFIDAGHGAGDSGARAFGYTEENMAIKFVNLVEKLLNKSNDTKVIKYDNNKNSYKDNAYMSLPNYDLYCEFHLNGSDNELAKGTELLITSKYKADATDKAINEALAKYFVNRGIKQRDDLQNVNVCASRGLNYRLIELCFISNSEDVGIFLNRMEDIAFDVANAILSSLGLQEIKKEVTNSTLMYLKVKSDCKSSDVRYTMEVNANLNGAIFTSPYQGYAIEGLKLKDVTLKYDHLINSKFHSTEQVGDKVWYWHKWLPSSTLRKEFNLPVTCYIVYKIM